MEIVNKTRLHRTRYTRHVGTDTQLVAILAALASGDVVVGVPEDTTGTRSYLSLM